MSDSKKSAEDLVRLSDQLVADILSTPADELLSETIEAGEDPALIVLSVQVAFEKAVAATGKRRLDLARGAVAADRARPKNKVARTPTDARSRLKALLAADPQLRARVTLAARQEAELSDADVQGVLDDLEELGVDTAIEDAN